MKKLGILLIVFLLLMPPCFSADPADSRRENYVMLRDYLERCISDQTRYIDTRLNSIDRTFDEKQRALDVGAGVLDAKFVRIDDFIKSTTDLYGKLSALDSRMTVIETKANVQEGQAAKWIIWLGVFFTVLQLLIMAYNKRRNGKV